MARKNASKKKQEKNSQKVEDCDRFIQEKLSNKRGGGIYLIFNKLAKKTSDVVGHAITFCTAVLAIIIWAVSGKFFHYSDTWQLVINTATTIITFLVVFLIQNTQNRDTEILNIKLDELIKAKKGASNQVINLADLSDKELKELETQYTKIKDQRTGE